MRSNWLLILLGIILLFFAVNSMPETKKTQQAFVPDPPADCWTGAGANQVPVDKNGELIRYGRNLIENTSYYLGPKGMVAHISNGMNCQNCHLEAGTKPWGNNYGAVASTYPKFRERSGTVESIEKRVNDCFERSLNGKAIDSSSKEMRAIVAYIKWLGKEVPKGEKPKGAGLPELVYMTRPASKEKGHEVYTQKCQSCHEKAGQGKL